VLHLVGSTLLDLSTKLNTKARTGVHLQISSHKSKNVKCTANVLEMTVSQFCCIVHEMQALLCIFYQFSPANRDTVLLWFVFFPACECVLCPLVMILQSCAPSIYQAFFVISLVTLTLSCFLVEFVVVVFSPLQHKLSFAAFHVSMNHASLQCLSFLTTNHSVTATVCTLELLLCFNNSLKNSYSNTAFCLGSHSVGCSKSSHFHRIFC